MTLKPPCEIMVKTYLPYIRRRLAQKLIEKGVSQRETAEKLGLTQAAVSQYMSKKRANDEINDPEALDRLADDFAEKLADDEVGEVERVRGICDICIELRSSKAICEPHLQGTDLEAMDCNICC